MSTTITKENILNFVELKYNSNFAQAVVEEFKSRLNGHSYTGNEIVELFKESLGEKIKEIESHIKTIPKIENKEWHSKHPKDSCRLIMYGHGTKLSVCSEFDKGHNISRRYKYYLGAYDTSKNQLSLMLCGEEVHLTEGEKSKLKVISKVSGWEKGIYGFTCLPTSFLSKEISCYLSSGKDYYLPIEYNEIKETMIIDFSGVVL